MDSDIDDFPLFEPGVVAGITIIMAMVNYYVWSQVLKSP